MLGEEYLMTAVCLNCGMVDHLAVVVGPCQTCGSQEVIFSGDERTESDVISEEAARIEAEVDDRKEWREDSQWSR